MIDRFPVEARYAEEPPLAAQLEVLGQRLNRLETEIIQGASTYPDWWYQESSPSLLIREGLQQPEAKPRYISNYFLLRQKEQRLRGQLAGDVSESDVLIPVCQEIGLETMARGFRGEPADGPIHTAIITNMTTKSADINGVVDVELALLSEAYGIERPTELLTLKGEGYDDEVRPLLRTEKAITAMRSADQAPGENVADVKVKTREWMTYALSVAVGIEPAEATNYVFAASQHVHSQHTDTRDFVSILDRYNYFGAERLRAISAFTGIEAFECYSVSQLELMEEAMLNPEESAKRLADHDVNVVMINRAGDRGTLRNTAETFDDGKKRTLLFEIKSLGDIYRSMLKLNDLGINPSTLVLAAHSAPGQFIVSDIRDVLRNRDDFAVVAGRALVKLANNNGDLGAGGTAYSMHDMKGFARLVEGLMRPSRAIDDATEDLGRKKVIFEACDAGSEVDIKDVNDQGQRVILGRDSVIGRLGANLAASGIESNVDIYGAPSGIQVRKTEHGIRYTSKPATLDDERQAQHAIRIRLENGNIMKQPVDEIAMHKTAA